MRLAYFSVPPPPNANRWVECNGTSVFFVRQHARTNGILGQTTLGHLKRRYAHFRVRRARKWVFRPYSAPPRPYGRSYGKNVDMYRKAIAKPTKKGHCDQVRSAHRFSATDRRTAAMVDFLPSEKTQNGPFFADTQSKPIFSQKGPISKWKMFTFLPKQCLGTVNSKGLKDRCVNPDFGPKWDVLRVLRVLRAPRATPNTRTRPHESWDHF